MTGSRMRVLGALMGVILAATFGCRPIVPDGSGRDMRDALRERLPETVQLPTRGIALGLDLREPGGAYDAMLWEVARTGATSVSLVVTASQANVRASAVDGRSHRTVADADLRRAIRSAHALGLDVMVFPIIWLEERAEGEWRGRLVPDDIGAWFASYAAWILDLAQVAAQEEAAWFCVGSELGSLESLASRWRTLIGDVRAIYSGGLLYSANWDHAHRTPFWDALDRVGVTGYYELALDAGPPAPADVVRAWAPHRDRLVELARRWDRPVVLTEVGYPAVADAARRPWDYTASGPPAPWVQAGLLEGLVHAFDGVPEVEGLWVWNWYGAGGVLDATYAPRQKPAEVLVQEWFRRPAPSRPSAGTEDASPEAH